MARPMMNGALETPSLRARAKAIGATINTVATFSATALMALAKMHTARIAHPTFGLRRMSRSAQ